MSDLGTGNVMASKSYVVTVQFSGMSKRLWFEGDDTEDAERRFREVCAGLDDVGDKCSEWDDFLNRTVAHFNQNGFPRIRR